ncbi:hypothetical protein OIY81_3527 [Cryptosporidium canis]|uniref:Uncharacterized protein n=1 Tax=Cryptosporidium canis TaxID=195482 RepID=A0A9D5DF51_9CRYT|nr:hypothetical protein OIY81_3527 [Cryptosporidium canis]KAJ1606611.1 hypothetical protein OJ253_2669 [Cryptosporidium canis]KAJ1609681.1 hypothetical protein OJ252_2123 [Cryptosporidium canis]
MSNLATQTATQGTNTQTQSSPSNPQGSASKKTMYPKPQLQQNCAYEQASSGLSSPYHGSVGSIPVLIQPPSTSVSPSNCYSVQPAQYIIDTPYYSSAGPYVAVPAAMLSPTVMASSPQMNATYSGYGFVPSHNLGYAALGASPTNSSRPTKYSPGCC